MSLVDEKLVQVEAGGLKFVVRDGSSDVKALREVIGRGSYERRDFRLESDGWVDLGANVGAFTCLAASRGARVVAVEPDPDNFSLLQRNVELNKLSALVELRQVAVTTGDEKSVALHVNSARKNFWRNSIVKSWRGGHAVSVPACHYSAILRPDWDCKMDIEGAEMPVLEALDKPFARRLVYEWSFDVDASIPRFSAVVAKLRGWYSSVVYGKFDETAARWGASWFPPCRTVWCQNGQDVKHG